MGSGGLLQKGSPLLTRTLFASGSPLLTKTLIGKTPDTITPAAPASSAASAAAPATLADPDVEARRKATALRATQTVAGAYDTAKLGG